MLPPVRHSLWPTRFNEDVSMTRYFDWYLRISSKGLLMKVWSFILKACALDFWYDFIFSCPTTERFDKLRFSSLKSRPSRPPFLSIDKFMNLDWSLQKKPKKDPYLMAGQSVLCRLILQRLVFFFVIKVTDPWPLSHISLLRIKMFSTGSRG